MLRAARLPGMFRLRFGAATVGAVVAYIVLGTTALRNPSLAASGMFHLLIGIAGIYALLSGAIHTADCIVSEKRGCTLGLLLLTELGPVDIVLGKFAPNALLATLTLISIFPVLAVPMALGGVTFAEFARVVSALVLVQQTSLLSGLLVSVLAREIRAAMTATLGGMLLLSGLPWFTAWMARGRHPAFADAIEGVSPASHVFRALERYHDTSIFSAQRFALGLMMLIFVIAACATLSRAVTTDIPEPSGVLAGRSRLAGIAGYRHIHYASWLESNPVLWFQRVFDPMPGLWRWGFSIALSGAVFLLAVAAFAASVSYVMLGLAIATIIALHVGLKLVSTLGAARAIGRARAEGLLEELLVAGVTPPQIVSGYARALFAEALPFLCALTIANALVLIVVANINLGGRWLDMAVVSCLGGVALLWFDHRTAVMSAMRYSLREADPMKAFRKVLVRILAPGWCLLLPSLVLALVDRDSKLAPGFAVLAFHPLFILTLWQHRRARLDLDHGFRDLSAGLEFDTDAWELREDFRRNLEWTGA